MPQQAPDTLPAPADGRTEALNAFKDWSNYLLVTTVAAIGWIAKSSPPPSVGFALLLAIWSFGLSAVFGIFALALVPLISEQMGEATDRRSIFTVPVRFHVGTSALRTMYLTQACRPQHVSFILGVLLYCVDASGFKAPLPQRLAGWTAVGPIVLAVTFVTISIRSHRRPPQEVTDPQA